MTKIKILKIDYVTEFPEDDYNDPDLKITVELEEKSVVELCTPNVNRIQNLIDGGFLRAGKTIDVPIKKLSDGRIFIDEEFEIKEAEKITKECNKKAKETFDQIGIDYVGR